MDYDEALHRLMGLPDFERSLRSPGHSAFHLERMLLLLKRLGNPHRGLPTVHIAGTKGKGSTSAMVTSILTADGYRVGLYTSPHLHSVAERIRVGMEPVPRREFAELVYEVWPAVDWVEGRGGHGPATFFEVLTAMAFLHFKRERADVQIIEVGLGGRLDATNVVEPTVCAITNISLDHTAILGDTLELIAAEKAGIVKGGVPVVLAPQPPEAMAVLVETAARTHAPAIRVEAEIVWRKLGADSDGQSVEFRGRLGRYDATLPLLGDHQIENAATAIAAVETLAGLGFRVTGRGVVDGLGRVRWPGRLERLTCDGTLVVVDGAHNPYSMRRLVQAVREHFVHRRVFAVFGATSGHSIDGMMAEVAGLSPTVVPVRSRHPKAAPAGHVAESATARGLQVLAGDGEVGPATRRAIGRAGESDLVLGTGSLSVAAEVIEEVKGMEPELYPVIGRAPAPESMARRA